MGEFLEDFIVHEDDVRFRIRKALKKVKIAPRGEDDLELPVGIQDLFQGVKVDSVPIYDPQADGFHRRQIDCDERMVSRGGVRISAGKRDGMMSENLIPMFVWQICQ